MKHKPHNYWTKERVFEESKKYTTRSEFKEKAPTAHSLSRANGWLDEMINLKYITKPNGYWKDKENVFNASKECESRSEFMRKYSAAYDTSRINGWLDEMTWLRKKDNKFIKPYTIYVYIDEENKVAYVGLTNDKETRHKTHKTGIYKSRETKSEVFKYFNSINKEVPDPKYLDDNLSPQQAREKEDYWKNYYKNELGYTMLNIAKCGSLGGGSKYWTKNKVFEESKNYKTRLEFARKKSSAYAVALHNNWLDEMTWLVSPQKPKKYWTKEKVMEVAKSCETAKSFRENYGAAYFVACKNKWICEMTWFKKPTVHNKKWYKENVFEEAKKYKNKTEFRKGNGSAYNVARSNNWFDEMTWFEQN